MFWNVKSLRLQIFALVAFAGVSVCRADVVAHYKFNETAGATTAVNEITANAGNGAIGTNVGVGFTGKVGNAVKLNNDASQNGIVDMANATGIFNTITTSGELTFSYWLNSTDIAANRSVAVFLGNNTDTNDYIDSGILGGTQVNPPAPNGSAYGRFRRNTDTQIGDRFGPLINDGNFHHLAMTVDIASTTGTFFVDGVQVSTETSATKYAAFPTLNNLEIGRLGRSAPVDPIDGLVDDLQIYDEALSIRQIFALFTNPGLTLSDLPPVVDGDTNGDGLVNTTDFNNIRNSLGYSGLTPGLGVDIAGFDGIVNFRDLRFFQQNYPTVAAAAMAEVVPEPGSLLLSMLAVGVAAGASRRVR